ncbi:MAG: GntR family transcriptional regulator [Duncaniella sp.]|nr:GntR family transcriptional regulator [Duncaniella sp.]MDE5734212.1 GntR family transcriptional regulator [Duncaniella sp.]MDE6177798.1 GntR family transcriptional regulator [Duncaniella sp.]
MVKIGKYNRLRVVKNVDFGAYLDGGEGVEILLPSRYIAELLHPGDEIEVFIYRDNEGRLTATTEHPFAEVGQFAFLQVTDVNRTGAFLDLGLMKELLLPFSEQTMRLGPGMVIPVYVYLDDATQRIVASAKIDKHLGNKIPRYHQGEAVKALVLKHTEIGYKCIVDNLFHGLIYESDLYRPLEIGKTVTAYVKNVREDGKIDLLMAGADDGRIDALADDIVSRLGAEPGHYLPLSDSSSPEAIRRTFSCSKKDFKKAIGKLYRQRLISIARDGISLLDKEE